MSAAAGGGAKGALLVLAALVAPAWAGAGESFDVSAYEKKAFEWGGFVEARPEHQWLDRDRTGYQLLYPGQTRDRADRLGAALEVGGVARLRSLTFNFTGHVNYIDEPRGSDHDARMYEAYGGWQIDTRTHVELGKRALRWGKGYAFSPVAFLERAKDPADPELAREGFSMATGTWVRSFDGALQTVAVTAAVVPTRADLNADFGPPDAGQHANAAVKLYGLLWDTDVDLVWAARGSRGPRIGVDFSRNLGSNLEIHGEWARSRDVPRALLAADGRLTPQQRTVDSHLLGLRYLTQRETTVIVEVYRNGAGYTTDELDIFHALVRASMGDPLRWPAATRAAAQGYNRPNAAQRYAYLRLSQKEPFDILDLVPALTLIVNTGDHSRSVIPELLYTGIANLELRLRAAFNEGKPSSEFGERAVRARVELRARASF